MNLLSKTVYSLVISSSFCLSYCGFNIQSKEEGLYKRLLVKATISVSLYFILVLVCHFFISEAMVRRYPPNMRGTKYVFLHIRVLPIQIYELSLLCLAMGINRVRDKGPRD